MILPRKNHKIKNLVINENSNGNISDINLDTLTKLINLELSYVNKFGIISEKLRNVREKTPYEIFLLIDTKHEKYLNSSNLLNFMKKYEAEYSEFEIKDIIFRLHKMEKEEISYEDFQEIFTPVKILKNEIPINDDKPDNKYNVNNNHDLNLNQDQLKDKEAESKNIENLRI